MSREQQNDIEDERGTSRLEAFSDGVFAVSITLLVLDIIVPTPGDGSLQDALLNLWPNYLAYVTSFLMIGFIWINHHHLFRYVKRTDQGLFLLNIFFLLFVGLIPFVTALVARYLHIQGEHTAAIVYSAVLLVMSFAFSGLWGYATTHPYLLNPQVDPRTVRRLFKRTFLGIPLYLCSALISFINVEASLALYILIAIFYALPVEQFLKRAQRREELYSRIKNRRR